MERTMLRRIKRLLYRSLSLIKRSSPRPPTHPTIYIAAEPIQLPYNGADGKHWLISVKEPVGSRDEIIDYYVKLGAQVLGSEDEARKAIYSVSTKYYFAIGVLGSEDEAYKWTQLPDVIDVVEDGYVDRVTKDYGGEPFVDGKPVPYDPKYHDFYHRVQAGVRAWKSGTPIIINTGICQDGGPAAGHIPTPAGSMPFQEYQVPPSNQVFEVVMVACPTYRWTIHGGRTGYIERSTNSICNYIAPKNRHGEYSHIAENQELPSVETRTRQIMRKIWKGTEQNEERLVVYQTAIHSRYSYDRQINNYMTNTTLLGEQIREELIRCCKKYGITPNTYQNAGDFLLAAKEGLGVYIYLDIMSAPKSGKTPFLAEIKVAYKETNDGMVRIDHPGASYVKNGQFFLVN